MEEGRQHPDRQQHIKVFRKNRYEIAGSKEAQNKDHNPLAVKAGHKERHGRPCHRYPQGKQADQPACLHHAHLIILGNIGQDADKAHFRIEYAKYPHSKDKEHYFLIYILFHVLTLLLPLL